MKRILLPLCGVLVLAGCNGGPNKTNIELVTNMMDQPSIKAQDWNPDQGNKGQMRMPPPNTVAQHTVAYKYADDPAAGDRQPNPLAGQMSPEVLSVGRKHYDIYCAVCHGETGAGDGPVAERMAVKPRNLVDAAGKAYSDGRIFHAISGGRGVMRPYISQIPDPETRWKIVNYVRSLQR